MRLKTKLVLAISGLVLAMVAALSVIYIAQLVRQRVDQAYQSGDFVAHQVFHAAREALEVDLSNSKVDLDDPAAFSEAVSEVLETDPGLNSLVQSVVGYSPVIYDVAIADAQGRALLHSDTSLIKSRLPQRAGFGEVSDGGFRQHLRVLYGDPRVYEVRIDMTRDGKPFGSVRVGLSTVFLKSALKPLLRTGVVFAGIAIVVSFILAAVLSNFALRPLALIGQRLDAMAAEPGSPAREAGEEPAERADEVGAVTRKIDRIGQQMRDVKEVFSALKENLDQIMANLQDGLILFTRDFQTVLVSASVENFLGRPRSEMLGRHIRQIFADDTRLGRAILAAFDAHQPLDGREVETENGRRVQVSLDFIEERGERIGALLTLRDAESVRRIEDEIELSRRLAAIGRLTSGVAHEVRNPINAIVVHLEVLRQKMQAADPDTMRHMDVIGSEIQRLDRVVQTLLDFTRPVDLKLSEVDLARLVDDVADLAAPDAQRQNVTVIKEICAEPLPVRADADLLKQALLNVVINGVQAMPNGGNLTMSACRREAEAWVTIRDQGMGIPAAAHEKIFNLYYTTKKGGSGIGLPMTYRVVQLHNGSLEFDSQEGVGTAFTIRVPLWQRTPAEQELAAKGEMV